MNSRILRKKCNLSYFSRYVVWNYFPLTLIRCFKIAVHSFNHLSVVLYHGDVGCWRDPTLALILQNLLSNILFCFILLVLDVPFWRRGHCDRLSSNPSLPPSPLPSTQEQRQESQWAAVVPTAYLLENLKHNQYLNF